MGVGGLTIWPEITGHLDPGADLPWVGDYRIIYLVETQYLVVLVVKIGTGGTCIGKR
jgi:hypothetical protein